MSYKIVKQEWAPDGMECEHALCDPLHKPYHERSPRPPYWFCNKPMATRTEWVIEDTATGEFLTVSGMVNFDLKRDAVKALKEHNSRSAQ